MNPEYPPPSSMSSFRSFRCHGAQSAKIADMI
ncbi:uncharacterized protein CLUP02_01080 [Colletotrichum lupini]|uniref:Uncharacterized protein n=1 Tax=Colletotrichum lupini TaxID=145971 RepID=A0A9Q8SC02_9PEZI|nr:uncharacterized protein CLUP02_01080 [Colletotrichum lupini]UQC74429.1 hypothetical protein CLUP02_01080 [Colletotrichum lupini]